nr:synaptobrevin, longin-like domain protein [Tanacetum cinerariifolium]
MVAILEKSEHNVDFHPIVDFIEASPLRYALTVKPTVYVSHIRQFWSTARIETTEEGTKNLATVDGILRTVTELSLRRNLKIQDEEGINSLPDTELFVNLTLMGYNISPNQKFTFQKGQFSHQWKYLIHTIMQFLSPKSTGFNEFSSNISTALVCLATNRTYNFSKMIFDGLVKNVNNKVSKFLMYLSPSFSGRIVPLFDTMLVPRDQDWANIAKTSTLPYDSAPRVTSPAAAEGSMQQTLNELTAFSTSLQRQHSELISKFEAQELEINRLKARVKLLENREGVDAERSRDDALIKVDQFPLLVPPAVEVPTGSDVVPTAGLIFATAIVVTLYTRRKGKETLRMNEQISRDTKIARIHAEEELQSMIDGLDMSNETVSKYLQEYQQFASELPLERRIELISDLVRGMTFEEIEAKFTTAWKQLEDFIPIGSKDEAERLKRKGLSLEQESMKKLNTSEEVAKEAKPPDEVPKEKIKEMMQLVPIEEVEDLNQLWALVKESLSNRPPTSDKEMELWVELKRLYEPDDADQLWTHTQNLMHAPDEWKLYDTCGVHHVTAKDKEISMLMGKDYPLRKGLAIGMISYKLQVDRSSSYFSWKPLAMGKNVSNAKTFLEKRYTDDMELDDDFRTGLSNLNKTGKSSNPSISKVSETSKKDLEDLFQDFYDGYFDSSKIMKSSTMNVLKTKIRIFQVASLIFWQWQPPSLAVGTYTASGNSILVVGMPCAFYSQQSSLKLDDPSALKHATEPILVILQLEPEKLAHPDNVPHSRDACFSPPTTEDSTVTPPFKSLELSAKVDLTTSAVAFEHNEEMGVSVSLKDAVELVEVGLGHVSCGPNDIVVSLSVGKKGDGLVPSSAVGEGRVVYRRTLVALILGQTDCRCVVVHPTDPESCHPS